MNKARFILITIGMIAFTGGILAFNVNRRSAATELWRFNGQFSTYTTFIGGLTYSTVLPICVPAGKWPTTVGPEVPDLLIRGNNLVAFYYSTQTPPTTFTTFVQMEMCLETITRFTTIEP